MLMSNINMISISIAFIGISFINNVHSQGINGQAFMNQFMAGFFLVFSAKMAIRPPTALLWYDDNRSRDWVLFKFTIGKDWFSLFSWSLSSGLLMFFTGNKKTKSKLWKNKWWTEIFCFGAFMLVKRPRIKRK